MHFHMCIPYTRHHFGLCPCFVFFFHKCSYCHKKLAVTLWRLQDSFFENLIVSVAVAYIFNCIAISFCELLIILFIFLLFRALTAAQLERESFSPIVCCRGNKWWDTLNFLHIYIYIHVYIQNFLVFKHVMVWLPLTSTLNIAWKVKKQVYRCRSLFPNVTVMYG